MGEKRILGSMEKTGFGTSVSFDLEKAPKPKRRRRSKKNSENSFEIEVSGCPGCGAEISHDDWLDSLVGFVSGAHSFMEGGPVKARIVQHLRNETSRMSVPQPREEWELEVVERLMGHLHSLVEAEANRMEMSRNQEAMLQVDDELISEIKHAIRPALEAEIRQKIEAEIRQKVEAELWQEFEQAWRQKSAGDEES